MQGSTQGASVGNQIGGSDNAERNEKYRLMSIRNTALHLAQKNSSENGNRSAAADVVNEAEIFFAFLNK